MRWTKKKFQVDQIHNQCQKLKEDYVPNKFSKNNLETYFQVIQFKKTTFIIPIKISILVDNKKWAVKKTK